MTNNAVTLSLSELKFKWPTEHLLHAYLVGVAIDNFGTLQVVVPPSSTHIMHHPLRKLPFSWPLAGDGFMFYQRTGGLPDFMWFSLMIVQDHDWARRAGEVLSGLDSKNEDFKGLLDRAAGLAGAASAAAGAVGAVVGEVAQSLLSLIGKQIEKANDSLITTINGSKHFDPAFKAQSQLALPVDAGIADVNFIFNLFEAGTDTASVTGLSQRLDVLRRDGLLVGAYTEPRSADESVTSGGGTITNPTGDTAKPADTTTTTPTGDTSKPADTTTTTPTGDISTPAGGTPPNKQA